MRHSVSVCREKTIVWTRKHPTLARLLSVILCAGLSLLLLTALHHRPPPRTGGLGMGGSSKVAMARRSAGQSAATRPSAAHPTLYLPASGEKLFIGKPLSSSPSSSGSFGYSLHSMDGDDAGAQQGDGESGGDEQDVVLTKRSFVVTVTARLTRQPQLPTAHLHALHQSLATSVSRFIQNLMFSLKLAMLHFERQQATAGMAMKTLLKLMQKLAPEYAELTKKAFRKFGDVTNKQLIMNAEYF